MRIRVQQTLTVSFEQPARGLMLSLKTMPRDHEGQVIVSWRIEPSIDGRLRAGEDAFGNRQHLFQADGPIEGLTISIDGLVETYDAAGVIRGAIEPLTPPIFLRQDGPAAGTADLIAAAAKAESPLARMHALMKAVHEHAAMRPAAPPSGQQQQQQSTGEGEEPAELSRTLARRFCAAAREMAVPARLARGAVAAFSDGEGVAHAAGEGCWAEAFIEGLGWVGFDPARRLCPTPAHLRIAVGLEASDIAPFRLAATGGGGERLRSLMIIAEG